MGKGTTETDESFKMFADVVGKWGFVILKTPLPCVLKIYFEDAHHLEGEVMSRSKLRLVITMKAPSPFGRRLG